MQRNELLDTEKIYGTKHLFVIQNNFVLIYEGRLKEKNQIRNIPIQAIKDLRYVEGKVRKKVVSFLYTIAVVILTENLLDIIGIDSGDQDRIEIDYHIEGELAEASFNTKLKPGELAEMRSLLNLSPLA